MPPLFTATNGMTLLRKVLHSARQVHPSISTRSALTSRLTRVQRARVAFRNALHETFPSLSTPSYQSLRLQPATLASRQYSTVGSSRNGSPLGQAGRVFRGSGFRLAHNHPRGPSIVGNVGLNPARNFSTAPPQVVIANAPVFLRALVSLDGDELPKSNRYIPYKRPAKLLRQSRLNRRRRSTCSSNISRSSWIQNHLHELEHFFPAPLRSPPPVELPLVPEQLITPGSTATLSLALSPSLQDLLQPTTEISYREAELGLSIFTNLLKDVPAVLQAFSIHGSTRVYPLLNKLASLGVLDTDQVRETNVKLEILPDHEGRPDIMNIVFPQRSKKDVQVLLGETLNLREGEAPWFALFESQPLEPFEDQAMVEHWDKEAKPEQSAATPVDGAQAAWEEEQEVVEVDEKVQDSTCDLIFPNVDFDSRLDQGHMDVSTLTTPPESYSWPASEASSQIGSPPSLEPLSPRPSSPTNSHSPDLRTEYSTWTEGPMVASTLTESLVSQLSDHSHYQPTWAVSLSASDSDIESSIDMSDLGEVEHELWSISDGSSPGSNSERQRPGTPDSAEWMSVGGGFGLSQPW